MQAYDEDELLDVFEDDEDAEEAVTEEAEHADLDTSWNDSGYEASEYEPQELPNEDEAAEAEDEPRKPMLQLPQEVNNRIAECLRYELTSIDHQIAHATDIAARDHFFDRWIAILETKRRQCVEALEKAEKAAEVTEAAEVAV